MRRFITFIFSICFVTAVMAECNVKFDAEAYRNEQHKYIIDNAKLTVEEAEKFFPIYDEMRAKEREKFKESRRLKRQKPTTDEACRKAIEELDKVEICLKKIQRNYHQKMLQVLPAQKVFDALSASERFDQKKFREMSRPGQNDNSKKSNNRR